MKRLEKFEKYTTEDLHGKKLFSKLNHLEIDLIRVFIAKFEDLDYNQFAEKVNRMFLSSEKWPTIKHGGEVQEILSVCAKTVPGFYGYEGTKNWIHPLDRKDEK